MRKCKNCDEFVQTRDEREGLVHTSGRYGCQGKKTVAE